ncbi:group II intron maturase-specific domain-containing protein [Sorangium sp. So ce124]|uniref:group II intron maturase-specific domain-containing protein n=1 Tax=Sorangium sp. So ce124 TaxID=3133280 RepID=UPI003F5F895E
MSFLGHHVLVRRRPGHGRQVSASLVPKERSQRLREKIKQLFKKRSAGSSLRDLLQRLNPILRGWANFYRHADHRPAHAGRYGRLSACTSRPSRLHKRALHLGCDRDVARGGRRQPARHRPTRHDRAPRLCAQEAQARRTRRPEPHPAAGASSSFA